MGQRSMKTRRRARNRFKNPCGKEPFQRWDPKTKSFVWVGGYWNEEKGRWLSGRKNWKPTAPLYFAYGSNLNVQQMDLRAPEAKPFSAFVLKDWKLVFNGVADIQAEAGKAVQGGLWRITGADELALDRYEGVANNFYVKDYFKIAYTNSLGDRVEEKVLVYLMAERARYGLVGPSAYYLDTIRQGYKDFNLDAASLEEAAQDAKAADEAYRDSLYEKFKASGKSQGYGGYYGRAWDKGSWTDGPKSENDYHYADDADYYAGQYGAYDEYARQQCRSYDDGSAVQADGRKAVVRYDEAEDDA